LPRFFPYIKYTVSVQDIKLGFNWQIGLRESIQFSDVSILCICLQLVKAKMFDNLNHERLFYISAKCPLRTVLQFYLVDAPLLITNS